ncbi:MAG: EAL domain-containing protein [Campylobacterales bacterium]|nr:EAL domain-containing protein [Campylobacterales bacterium]
MPDMLWIKDVEGRYLFANKAICDRLLMAHNTDEPIGKTDLFFATREREAHADKPQWHTFGELCFDSDKIVLQEQHPMRFEEYGNIKGEMVYLEVHKAPLYDDHGRLIGTVGSGRDITEQVLTKQALIAQTEKLDHQSNHDTLTDLPNRQLFQDRLTQAISRAKRSNTSFALFFIDLDHFKKINDSLGHDIGDQVIIEIAERLRRALREEDTLARIGGDEFTVLIEGCRDLKNLSTLAQKLIELIKAPITVTSHTLYVSSSIGISIYPQDAEDPRDLLKYADSAMYRAKDEGRDNFEFYTQEMTELAFERVVMETSLRIALAQEEFILFYQPKYNAATQSFVGSEALIRWGHSTMGIVSPAKFIPLAEETGLIVKIDRWVMNEAMRTYTQWYEAGLNPGTVSLNLSIKQLEQEDFIEVLQEAMQRHRFRPEWLELEITESQVMKNPEKSIRLLEQIHALGITLAIDDFGTGYSSLAYLKRLKVDTLKIDQSFVRDIPFDEEDSAIVNAIIALAQSLKLDVIAEGVETQAQLDFLLEHGCCHIQGYLTGRPKSADAIEELLRNGR